MRKILIENILEIREKKHRNMKKKKKEKNLIAKLFALYANTISNTTVKGRAF